MVAHRAAFVTRPLIGATPGSASPISEMKRFE
jgi:hypothetical protein